MNIGLIGIGRLGTQIAKSFLMHGNRVKAFHHDQEKLEMFCSDINDFGDIEPIYKIDEFKDKVTLIVLALPPDVTPEISRRLNKLISRGQWVVNTATDVYLTELYSELGREKLVAAKIIGNASEIEKGENPGVVVDGRNEELVRRTKELFSQLGYTIEGNESMVSKVNKIGAIEAIRTVLRIEKKMDENNIELDDEMCNALLCNVVAGTIKTYSQGNIGPFLEKLITQLKKETLK